MKEFNNMVNDIISILGDYDDSVFKFIVRPSDLYFLVYDCGIIIDMDWDNKKFFLAEDNDNHKITPEMMKELGQVLEIMNNNYDVIWDAFSSQVKNSF